MFMMISTNTYPPLL